MHTSHATQASLALQRFPIVEFRQYTLRPDRREAFIELFEREFLESQQAVGMQVLGQFRDLDHPDRFVWLRGFPDMPTRAEALSAFYYGPVWKAHREEANASIIDSDNVLLLRPARAAADFALETTAHPAPDEQLDQGSDQGLVVATTYHFDAPVDERFLALFEDALLPTLAGVDARSLGYFVTEDAANNFPALPVREGEHVFVWFAGFPHLAAFERHAARLAASHGDSVTQRLIRSADVTKLQPTSRSLIRG